MTGIQASPRETAVHYSNAICSLHRRQRRTRTRDSVISCRGFHCAVLSQDQLTVLAAGGPERYITYLIANTFSL
jgi:hypothetical protein